MSWLGFWVKHSFQKWDKTFPINLEAFQQDIFQQVVINGNNLNIPLIARNMALYHCEGTI